MVDLKAKSALDGLVPLSIGPWELSDAAPEAITEVMPLKGSRGAFDAALGAAGLTWPGPGNSTGKAGARMLSTGPGRALFLGVPLALDGAALVDQSSAYAVIRLAGPGVEMVLARLCPLDLRAGVFKRGASAPSLLGHMRAQVSRIGPDSFEILVARSMSATAVHELAGAMRGCAARLSGRSGAQ